MSHTKIDIAGGYEDLCENVTREILELSNKVIAAHQRFTLVLSGGSTPKGVYQCMSSPSYRDKFSWDKIHFFWSDERWVPPEDIKSNLRMVYEALFSKVKIPPANIHLIPTAQGDIKDSARHYEESIRDFFKLKSDEFPRFDLVLLGLGQDGHTASLFPGNPALLETQALAMAVSQTGIPEERITLTFPAINHAEMIFFIVSGPEKADIVHDVLGNENKGSFPAQKIIPFDGNLGWFLDKDAAGKLVNVRQLFPSRIGIAADHGGYHLKEQLTVMLRDAAYEVIDFGDHELKPDDDYPDFVIPLAQAVSRKEVDRGVAICGSGVGACIAANKVHGVRACMIHEEFSARQGVEDDDMNVICLGSRVLEQGLAWELVVLFLTSRFSNAERHRRRLAKVSLLEKG